MNANLPSTGTSQVRDALAPENLPYQMFLLVQQMTKRFQEVLTPHGITPLHWGVLCCLWREDGLRTTEIANSLEQLGGTVTVGLDAMERDGLVQRKKDQQDRRITRIFLTKRGKSLRKTLESSSAILIGEMFATFPPQAYQDLAHHVAHLRQALSEHIDPLDSSVKRPVSRASKASATPKATS